MSRPALDIVFLGLSITSSWGNGHATTYRGLLRALAGRGHRVLFLERDVPWYAQNRDLPRPPYGSTELYGSLEELRDRFGPAVRAADLVVLGSFVPEGRAIARWVVDQAGGRTAFYDIDTPATLAALARGACEYLEPALVPRFDLYLSFTGGPVLGRLERDHGARRARPLYCSADPGVYFPVAAPRTWALGYMGTYSSDRQPALDRLLLDPARQRPGQRFVVAGPLYPDALVWPRNVDRIAHLSPGEHRAFYCRQRLALNLTRTDMAMAGHSPSVRLFEAAACAVAIVTDPWPGLEAVLAPGREILVARTADDVLRLLDGLSDEETGRLGARARSRFLAEHTAEHRAAALERYFADLGGTRPRLTGRMPSNKPPFRPAGRDEAADPDAVLSARDGCTPEPAA